MYNCTLCLLGFIEPHSAQDWELLNDDRLQAELLIRLKEQMDKYLDEELSSNDYWMKD